MPKYTVATSDARLAIDIMKDGTLLAEVYYVSFPRFEGTHCRLSTLDHDQQSRFCDALESANEVAKRFTDDGRDATKEEIVKAFNRTFSVNEASR